MERLTYNEILQKYPNMHVGLTEVRYMDNDGISVESGVVSYTSQNTPYDKLLEMALGEKIDLLNTNLGASVDVGVVS